jgi:two-component system NtrC family sensor kinase
VTALTSALREAELQQRASAEILHVISASPADVQPVFDTILRSAVELLDAHSVTVFRLVGDELHLAALTSIDEASDAAVREGYPVPLATTGVARHVLETRQPYIVTDVETDPVVSSSLRRAASLRGYRSMLSVPLVHQERAIGLIAVTRRTPGAFTDSAVRLLQIFAAQAVIAIENVRLVNELKDRNHALIEAQARMSSALAQQTATAEILRVIASSPTDVQPVFDAITRSALRLLGGLGASLTRVVGDDVHLVSLTSTDPAGDAAIRSTFPIPMSHAPLFTEALASRNAAVIADMETTPGIAPEIRDAARQRGYRSLVLVPLTIEQLPAGYLLVSRAAAGGFDDAEVELLKSFADQAAIAIANVRMFTELQEKNRALTGAHAQVTETLDRQTATGEILKVISSSRTDAQPVFDAIARSAVRLCGGVHGGVFRLADDVLSVVAHANLGAAGTNMLLSVFPCSPERAGLVGLAVRQREVIHSPDVERDPRTALSELARRAGYSSLLAVPIMRSGEPIGAIVVTSTVPFTPPQMELLLTFADQAVIAIENVRLFTELQEKNRALTGAHRQVTEALQQQTATSEILRTIAQSQTDVQPVFDTIVRSAARRCRATIAGVFHTDGTTLYHLANCGESAEALAAVRARYPRRLDMETAPGLAILTRSVVHIPDSEAPSVVEHVRQVGRVLGFRSVVTVPMLQEGEAIGAIAVTREQPGRFPDGEVELLKTFADQAVIAIENVRLFTELQARTRELTRSVEQLTALGEVGRAVSFTLDLETVLTTIVTRAVQLSGLDGGVVFEYDDAAEEFVQRAATEGGALADVGRATRIRKGESWPCRGDSSSCTAGGSGSRASRKRARRSRSPSGYGPAADPHACAAVSASATHRDRRCRRSERRKSGTKPRTSRLVSIRGRARRNCTA